MAANPYDSQSIAGYNSSPPPDDGSQTSANRLEWAKHKTKLADPIKTLSEAINAEVLSAFGELVLTTDPAEETMIVAMDHFLQNRAQPQRLNLGPASENAVVGSAFLGGF